MFDWLFCVSTPAIKLLFSITTNLHAVPTSTGLLILCFDFCVKLIWKKEKNVWFWEHLCVEKEQLFPIRFIEEFNLMNILKFWMNESYQVCGINLKNWNLIKNVSLNALCFNARHQLPHPITTCPYVPSSTGFLILWWNITITIAIITNVKVLKIQTTLHFVK